MPRSSSKTTVPKPLGFFKTIGASVHSPGFYKSIPRRGLWRSLAYFTGITLLCTVALGFFVLALYLRHHDEIEIHAQEIVHFYPDELVLTMQNGELSTNVEQPYFMDWEDFLPAADYEAEWKSFGQAEHLLVIDTETPFSHQQFIDYDALLWIHKDAIYTRENSNQVKTVIYDQDANFIVNKEIVDTVLEQAWPRINALIPTLGVIMFLAAFAGLMMLRLVYALILALLILLMNTLRNLSYDFAGSYKTALHAMTLPVLLQTILWLTAPWTHFAGFPLLFTLLALLVVAVNVKEEAKDA